MEFDHILAVIERSGCLGNRSIDCCPVRWSMSDNAPFEP
jgi:hypothetical protein